MGVTWAGVPVVWAARRTSAHTRDHTRWGKKKIIHTAGGRTALWFESKEKKAADSAKKKKKTRLGTEQVRGFGRRHSSGWWRMNVSKPIGWT